MFSLKPVDLMQEIRDGEKRRDLHLDNISEIIRRVVGAWYRADNKTDPTPENVMYSYIAYVLPQMVMEDPTTTYAPADEVGAVDIAEANQLGLDQWIKRVNAKDTLHELAFDILVGFGATMVSLEERGDYNSGGLPGVNGDFEQVALTPTWTRLHRANIIIDGHCKELREARFVGRKFVRDLDDLLEDDRYDQEALSGASPQQDDPANQKREPFKVEPLPNDRRKVVTLYELYIPEYRKLITLMEGQAGGSGGTIVRDVDYHGPEDGPFQLWGDLFISGELYPLSPMQAQFEQTIELNAHAVKAAEEAGTFKQIAVVNSNDSTLAKNLGSAKNGSVWTAQDANAVVNITLGGTSPERLAYIETLRARADRVTGSGDAQRGSAQGNKTATADDIAKAAGDVRITWHRLQLKKEFKKTLSKVDWYHWHEGGEAISYQVTKTNQETGQKWPATFIGGRWPGDENYEQEDFQLDVDTHDDAQNDPLKQKRAQDLLALMSTTVPLIMQFPQFGWDKVIDIVGDSMKLKKLSRMILPAVIQQIADPMAQMQIQGVGTGNSGGGQYSQSTPGTYPQRSAQSQVGGVQAPAARQLAGPASAA